MTVCLRFCLHIIQSVASYTFTFFDATCPTLWLFFGDLPNFGCSISSIRPFFGKSGSGQIFGQICTTALCADYLPLKLMILVLTFHRRIIKSVRSYFLVNVYISVNVVVWLRSQIVLIVGKIRLFWGNRKKPGQGECCRFQGWCSGGGLVVIPHLFMAST